MKMKDVIEDVSDTALWVAAYRAQETQRPDAVFHDRFAARLAGEKGEKIAEKIGRTGFVAWMIVVRTCIIDAYIRELIAEGVDTVLNLGAGLDTRPYRLELSASLRWIEVDYTNIIDRKEARLRDEQPQCRLQRVRLDLADQPARKQLFADVSSRAEKVAILTEGVIPVRRGFLRHTYMYSQSTQICNSVPHQRALLITSYRLDATGFADTHLGRIGRH